MYPPANKGLYDPAFEHDACGVGFVVDMHGRRSHSIVEQGLTVLANLDHRGAQGAEKNTDDGAGILIQMPDSFLREVVDFELPITGAYAAGMAFLPAEPASAEQAMQAIEAITASEGLEVLGWRDVPVDPSILGKGARDVMPTFRQLFIDGCGKSGMDLERLAVIVRKRAEREVHGVYFPSLSARTLVYKGMLVTGQLLPFFTDLSDARLESCLALVHSRFSTNTFPSWPLAHP